MSSRAPELKELSENELEECREMFDMFDMDGNGRISKTELSTIFRAMSIVISDKDLEKTLTHFDLDKSGFLEFEDFIRLRKYLLDYKQITKEELSGAFKVFDKNGSGFIEKHELKDLVKALEITVSDEELSQMFAVVDRDNNGEIDYNEFADFLMNSSSQSSQKTMGQ